MAEEENKVQSPTLHSAKPTQYPPQRTPAQWLPPRAEFSCRLCRESKGGCFDGRFYTLA
jgi:hypothetical protein